ncbi:MAG TPA: class II fructose-bisphosphate aldolase [Candidatus Paceibacterota bacterium]|nr:class II fructose-bisphosphate aldolase [Candidatus Paceibacterota bacterium]
MPTLKETIQAAWEKKIALGHFNVSDSNQFNAVLAAAANVGQPVLIGVSEGERKFFGVRNIAALVRAARAAGVQVYLNADHTYSIDACKEVVDAGFDSVIFDGSHLDLEENIAQTKAVVDYVRQSGRGTLVEGEIGRIGTSSKLLDAPPADLDKDLTDPQEAARFVNESGIDMLAPAVGTMHGRIIGGAEPKIDIARIEAIRNAAGVPLVLHGGSGSSDADLAAAGAAGCSIVHINTDIRVAYRKGIESSLAADAKEIAPYKFLGEGVVGVEKVTEKYIRLFAEK